MCMSMRDISEEIITQYDIRNLETNGRVYIQVEKGMPVLKQAGKNPTKN